MKKTTLLLKGRWRTALLVLALSVVGMGKGNAQSFTYGNLNYSVNEGGTTVTVTGHVNGTSATGALNIPANVTYGGLSYVVTTIGNCAFQDCSGLTTVSFPNTLTTIGINAFIRCRGFTSVTLPVSVTFIGNGAFMNCSNIVHTNYIGTIDQWCSIVFENNGSNPIFYSHNLFLNGIELTDAIIPETVTYIGDWAFWLCNSLVSICIPASVTSIGLCAFGGYSKLEQITVMEGNPNYDSRNNCNALIETHTNTLLVSSNNTVIPNTVTALGIDAFFHCNIASVNIPASLISIPNTAFMWCGDSLQHIAVEPENPIYNSQNNCNAIIETASNKLVVACKNTLIPESVSIIGKYAFQGRTNLSSISIPKFVTLIEDQAFNYCALDSVISESETPPNLGNIAFSPCALLIVPCGCASAYQASDWANYFTTIEEDCASHDVNIDEGSMAGGSVSTSVNSTNMGEEVQIIIMPEDGMILSSLTVSNSNSPDQHVYVYPIGKSSLIYGFIMPPFDVTITAIFSEITSANENNVVYASVYPNPTKGQVKIEGEDIKHITIINMLGQVIYESNAIGEVFEYDFDKHGAGIYLVRIETGEGVATKRVVVTR